MHRGRSHRTLGLIPVLLQLWVLSMHRASHSVVNIKRMQQSIDLTNINK
jgi:hypothetical protein